MSNRARIGKINYANVWPVFFDFPGQALADQVEFLEQTPAMLNHAMLHDEIDMGFISTYAYLLNPERYELLPDLSISAHGRVSSILLFHEQPLSDIASGRFALANSSATSSHLLKIMLELHMKAKPEYVSAKPDLKVMLEQLGADGALLIGNDAIQASFSAKTRFVTDMGEWWLRFAGAGMTYALWAVRRDFAAQNRDLLERMQQALQASKKKGLAHLPQLASLAKAKFGGSDTFWQQYYGQLRYEFGEAERAAIAIYHKCLQEIGCPVGVLPFSSTSQVKL